MLKSLFKMKYKECNKYGEPFGKSSMIYAYLTDEQAKSIENPKIATIVFSDVYGNACDNRGVEHIECVTPKDIYDKYNGVEIPFGIIIGFFDKEKADELFNKLTESNSVFQLNENKIRDYGTSITFNNIDYDKNYLEINISDLDYPTSLQIVNYIQNKYNRQEIETFLFDGLYNYDNAFTADLKDGYMPILIPDVLQETDIEEYGVMTLVKSHKDLFDREPAYEFYFESKQRTIDKFAQMEKVANKYVKRYETDFYIHDIIQLSYPKEDNFLWVVRDSGTWLIPESEVYNSPIVSHCLFHSEKNWYKVNANDLQPHKIRNIEKYLDKCEEYQKAIEKEQNNDEPDICD